MKGEDLPKKKKKERKKKKKKKERRSIEKKKIPTVSFFCNGQFRFQESFGSAGFDFLNLGDHDRGGIDALAQKRTCLSFILIILSLDHDADNGQTNRVHEGTSGHSGVTQDPHAKMQQRITQNTCRTLGRLRNFLNFLILFLLLLVESHQLVENGKSSRTS